MRSYEMPKHSPGEPEVPLSIVRDSDHELFKLLVSTVKDYAIFVLSPEGYVMTWNDGAQRIKGYKAKEIIGRHFSTFYTQGAKDSRHPDQELKLATQNGRYEEEGWRVRKDGTMFWANVVITPLYNNNTLIGFAKVTRDLTERKQAEELRERHLEQIAETMEELQRLAYVVSHELQAPISTAIRYCNLLSVRYKDRLGTDADEFIDKISTSSQLIARMVDDLWTFARISRPYAERETLFMRNIVDAALDELKDRIGDNEVTCGDMPSIDGNKQQLVYLFKELVSNAIRYRSSLPPRIEIQAEREENGYIFSVTDNGKGIDPVRSTEVFTLFHRLEGGPGVDATGMGLPICKKIVSQHNGRIWFDSCIGSGTTVYFWLPER